MLPLLGLAVGLVPDLIKLIAGDKAGAVATDVANAVSTATGTTDPVQAKQKIDADPQVAAALQQKLAEIALEAAKAQNAEADAVRRDELDRFKASLSDVEDSRNTLIKLADKESPVAYGAPIVSIIVALGFFVILALAFFFPGNLNNNNAAFALIGTMATAFATMISFWLGSSQGSRNKDETSRQLQLVQSNQTATMLRKVQTVPFPSPSPTQPGPDGATPDAPQPGTKEFAAAQFTACMQVLFTLEGGYTDDPRDRGGATNYGVTRPDLAEFRHVSLDTITATDVQNLTLEEATEIYRTKYWNVMRCDDLPPGVDLMVFHFGVNAGPATSARVLQDCVGTKMDGSIGPDTLNATRGKDAKTLIGTLSEKQLAYYRGLADWANFSKGWSSRVGQAVRAALQMATGTAA